MNKEERIADFKQMYDSLTDPEAIARNKRATELKAFREMRIADTGL